jgi:Sec-independent protein translocase protein TatA
MIGGWEIPALVIGALVLFGADKVPKLARGFGQAKKEFLAGQSEDSAPAQAPIPPDKPQETKQP